MSLTPEMQAALEAADVALFGCLKIELPDYTIRLVDGSATLVIGSETYVGRDPVFGTAYMGSEFSDGDAETVPHLTLTFLPPDDTSAATLANSAYQGAPVTMMVGAVYRETGQVVPDPVTMMVGELDTCLLAVSRGQRVVTMEVVSALAVCFEEDEGARLNDGFHQSIWPGELGFQFVTVNPTALPWGAEGGRPVISTAPTYSATDGNTFLLRQSGFFNDL